MLAWCLSVVVFWACVFLAVRCRTHRREADWWRREAFAYKASSVKIADACREATKGKWAALDETARLREALDAHKAEGDRLSARQADRECRARIAEQDRDRLRLAVGRALFAIDDTLGFEELLACERAAAAEPDSEGGET